MRLEVQTHPNATFKKVRIDETWDGHSFLGRIVASENEECIYTTTALPIQN